MLTTISIKNFRCFADLTVEHLGRINLISGKNSAGKTSLLEAIFLLIGASNPSLVLTLSALRGIAESFQGDLPALREILWRPLFLKFGPRETAEIFGMNDSLGVMSLALQVTPEAADQLPLDLAGEATSPTVEATKAYALKGMFRAGGVTGVTSLSMTQKGPVVEPAPGDPVLPGYFLAAGHRERPQQDAERLGRLEVYKREIDLVAILRPLEPRLLRLSTIAVGGIPVIHGDVGLDRLLPIPLMGDGLRRLTTILLTIATTQGGVVLIDEVENGLHHSVLRHAWRVIADAAQSADVQVFATTHSFECIQAAHEVFADSPIFRLHRVERVREKIVARTYDAEALAAAMKAELEVR